MGRGDADNDPGGSALAQPEATPDLPSRGAAAARRADRSIVIIALVVLALVGALLVWALADVLLLVFAGTMLSVFLLGLGGLLSERTPIPEAWSVVIVLLLLAALLGLGGTLLGAEIANQLNELGPRLKDAWETALDQLYRYEWGRMLLMDRLPELAPARGGGWVSRITGVFSTTLGVVASLLIVLFIGLYGAVAPDTYRNGVLRLIPRPGRPRAGAVLDELGATLRWWLIGTFFRMAVVGAATTLGLWLLGMPLALALGLIAFLFDFVPYLGPLLAAIPAVLVALTMGPTQAAWVVLLYLAIQTAENYIVTPLVEQRSVHLPPALAISAQVLFGAMLGAFGVLFATPLTAAGMVLVKMLYIEDQLGEPTDANLRHAGGLRTR